MCGIAGILTNQSGLLSVQRLVKMTEALAHRGPDGDGHWINDNHTTGFGHRRLSIIDLSPAGAQPMHYLGRYTIIHNGEIYNYLEVRDALLKKGYQFHSQSDTEVIMAAYDCYRSNCLQYFDGMFAFAIWDEQEQTLFAARDRFGEKPFYYYLDDNQFVFASEMKALWAAGIEKQINEKMFFNYFTLGYTQNPATAEETFYTGINKLPARSFIEYHVPKRRLTRSLYWNIDVDYTEEAITDEQAIRQFNSLFTRSVQRRLRSDVPVGTSLSGGLDSSCVLATIQTTAPRQYNTFSAVFPGFKQDESGWIKKVAAHFTTHNHAVQPNADRVIHDFEKICYHQEEPFQSASIMAQYYVYELARQHGVTVLLDGQGADEILAGYHKYYHWYWQQLFRDNKNTLHHELTHARSLGINEPWGLKNKLAAAMPTYAGWYLRRQRARQQLRLHDLSNSFVDEYGESYYDIAHFDELNNILYYNTFVNGLEELLRYADRNAMAHGIEVRLPFLSHELVQLLFAIPARFKMRDGYTKWLLCKSMEDKLPAGLAWRTDKIGFEPPQQQWMQEARLQEYIHESKRILVKQGMLKAQALDKKIQPQEAHAADNYDWRYLVAGQLLR
ncbi:asparagine synthase (glutamine-hydrolyzing) [Niastella koreensis]|uniref:asparagine synthase (glutamine-hydrolyzing) n=1 Tax=Niastella koreensis TaxID=354356 RepID=A0ABX3P588_9BACT|nr:asparagine synthase (glutamine-hydrolyzing) [Niastella koreensis]OQP55134.1 asparagine synthase (glutamine-hydrolyzing) [Niastella koreensis]